MMNTGDSHWSYDAIASVYATDMGQSMPFDDVGFYRELALAANGPVLELGCGTGRILLPLLRAGVDAVGVDRSLPMLQQLRQDGAGLSPRVAQMDLRALGLRGDFQLVLAPYSLLTYLTADAELDAFMDQTRDLLGSDGALLLDAFIPGDVQSFADFRRDYLRPHANGQLERAKRIQRLDNGSNRIERRYRLLDSAGALQREFTTVEVIRPYRPDDLRALLARHALRLRAEWFDYRKDASPAPTAKFYSVLAGA